MPKSPRQILIAEDNLALSAVLAFNLKRVGFEVTAAKTGTDAWEILQQEEFDLFITDHQMPGLSGVALIVKIRESLPHLDFPIVLLTAKTLELDSDRLLNELKVDGIFSKPFSPSEIVKTVTGLLSSRRRIRRSSQQTTGV